MRISFNRRLVATSVIMSLSPTTLLYGMCQCGLILRSHTLVKHKKLYKHKARQISICFACLQVHTQGSIIDFARKHANCIQSSVDMELGKRLIHMTTKERAIWNRQEKIAPKQPLDVVDLTEACLSDILPLPPGDFQVDLDADLFSNIIPSTPLSPPKPKTKIHSRLARQSLIHKLRAQLKSMRETLDVERQLRRAAEEKCTARYEVHIPIVGQVVPGEAPIIVPFSELSNGYLCYEDQSSSTSCLHMTVETQGTLSIQTRGPKKVKRCSR